MQNKIKENENPAVELPVDVRDWFAIHAPEPPEWWLKQQQQAGVSDLQRLVKWRWVWADAMIAGRGDPCSLAFTKPTGSNRHTAQTIKSKASGVEALP